MIITLSRDEMLKRARLAGHLEPFTSSCIISYTDGIDLDATLEEKIRRRYARWLLTAPKEELPVSDFASGVSTVRLHEGLGCATLPSDCLRIFEIQLPGWAYPVAVEQAECLPDFHMAMDNPYTGYDSTHPRAVLSPDGKRVYVCPLLTAGKASLASGVLAPDPGTFIVEEAALTEIFTNLDEEE